MKILPTFLFGAALLISLVLGAELVEVGYTKFVNIYHGLDDSISLDAATRIPVGLAYAGLNLLYTIWVFRELFADAKADLSPENSTPESAKANIVVPNKTSPGFAVLLLNSAVFLIIAFLIYPIGSDIYLYLHYGLMALHDVNPFLVNAGDFLSELSPFIRWNQTSTYGPLSQGFFMVAGLFAPLSPVLAIYVFKLICLSFHGLNAYIVWHLLKGHRYQYGATLAYVLNPLLLFEQVSVAHVDVFVCTALLGMILCFQQRRYVWGILAIWLGFLAKTLPIIWLPLALVFLVRQRRWASLTIALLFISGSVLVLQQTLLPTPLAWKSLLNPGVQGKEVNSLHVLFQGILANTSFPLSYAFERLLKQIISLSINSLGLLIFASLYGATLIRLLFIKETEDTLFLAFGWITLVLLLFATPWLMPWYCSALVPIAVLQKSRRLAIVTFVFCFSSSCGYVLINTGAIQSLVVAGLPILALLLQLIPHQTWLSKST